MIIKTERSVDMMESIVENLGKNIRKHRMKLGMLQSELAVLIDYSEQAISKWERGKGAPPVEVLPLLCKHLKTNIDSLFSECKEGQRYYLGIDGGGTKTDFALADSEGNMISRVVLGACNPNDVGISEAQDVLLRGITEVCHRYQKNSISVFLGFAGGASDKHAQKMLDYLCGFGFAEAGIGEDTQNSVAAGLGDENGVAVIIGTGSVVYAKYNEQFYRYGGYGYLLGDEGSGYAIGRDTVHAALMSEDGSGTDTLLHKYVLEACGTETVFEKIDDLYRTGKRAIAKFSPLAFRAMAQGDETARDILERNFGQLAHLIGCASQRIKTKCVKVVLCGGMTADSDVIIPILTRALPDGEKTILFDVCSKPMVWGALRLSGMPDVDFEKVREQWN